MLARSRKFFFAAVPFVGTLVAHFAGATSDAFFVWSAIVTALTAVGVYMVPNTP